MNFEQTCRYIGDQVQLQFYAWKVTSGTALFSMKSLMILQEKNHRR